MELTSTCRTPGRWLANADVVIRFSCWSAVTGKTTKSYGPQGRCKIAAPKIHKGATMDFLGKTIAWILIAICALIVLAALR